MKDLNEHEVFWVAPNVVVRQNGQIDRYCGLEFCNRSLYARGICKEHYRNWQAGRPLRPILTGEAFSKTTCSFPHCGAIATTKMPGSTLLCGAHISQRYQGKDLRPVNYRLNAGYNADRTARTCKICHEEQPLSEFYDRNQSQGRTNKSTICKVCYRKDVAYGQGKRNTKADGTDPKNYAGLPGLMEQTYRAHLDKSRERQRRKEEAKKNANL